MNIPSPLSPDNVLRFLQLRGKPASTNEISQGLRLKKADSRPLFKMLAKLKKRRAIEELPGGRYRLPGSKSEREPRPQQAAPAQPQQHARPAQPDRDELKGRLILHPDGYGFVVPEVPIPQLDGDVFIPRDAIEDAMHGDHVLVKVQRRSSGPGAQRSGVAGAQRAEGRIVRVLD